MKVQEILAKKGARVVTARPEATVQQIVESLSTKRIGAVVISRDGATVLGLVAERTVIRGLAEHGAGLLDMTAGEIMETGVSGCLLDDSVAEVMRRMTLRRARHLPVVEHDRLAGIISIGDVVKSRLDDLELETNVLRDVVLAGH